MQAVRLRTENLNNPIGISSRKPVLSWNCEGGKRQSAYRILAYDADRIETGFERSFSELSNQRAGSEQKAAEGSTSTGAARSTEADMSMQGAVIWDSGKVASDQMAYIPWGGEELYARADVIWKVMLWDEEERAGEWSEEARFELAIEPADWTAKWIAGAYKPYRKANQALQYMQKSHPRFPVDCFLREIKVARPVRKARIYASACGLYEISIDGIKAGDACLAPGITDYRKRVQLQTIDVTDAFQKSVYQEEKEDQNRQEQAGDNTSLAQEEREAISGQTETHTVTVMLADGWYRGSTGAWGLLDKYGTQTKFIAQIEITYTDGSVDRIGTDRTWQWCNDGPIRFADNKDGENVDARKTPSWSGHAIEVRHNVLPVPSNNVPMREKEVFRADSTKISRTPSGKVLVDFSQNFAGWIAFTVQAKAGQRLKFRMGEMLDEQGELTLDNIQCKLKDRVTPRQEVRYICKDGENRYKTRFAIFGFQYAEISGDKDLLEQFLTGKAEIEGIAVYSDMEQTGTFQSSNDLLNKLVDATIWSTKSNSADLPTDCPTRERHGWTGDAQIFFNSASYLFDYRSFSRKYLNDLYDWQKKDGKLPQIVPDGGADFFMGTMNGSSGWADVGILMPYRYAKIFGDEGILTEYYERMKRYARFLEKRCGRQQILSHKVKLQGPGRKYLVNDGPSYGEWAEPADVFVNNWTEQVFPHPEVSTAYTSYVLRLMAEIADQLGHDEDAEEFRKYSEGCREAYQELVETEGFSLDTDRQANLVRPLYMDLLTDDQKAFARKRLIRAMENYKWRLGTGFLSTPLILDVLMDIDEEAAYRLLENEEIPGWLSMPKQGATTIWESWEGSNARNTGIGSLNHYSKGAVVEWLFAKMCGITVDGIQKFRIEPHPGGHFTFADASYLSVYGRISSGWKKTEAGYTYEIEIPANTTAAVAIDGEERICGPGKYTFTM